LSFPIAITSPFIREQVLMADELKAMSPGITSVADLSGDHGKKLFSGEVQRLDAGAPRQAASSNLSGPLHAKDFGVKCDGLADDTFTINNALRAATGKTIFFPSGTCNYAGGGVLDTGTVLVGAGRNATVVRAIAPAATLFSVSGYGAGIRGVAFRAAVTQTGGAYVALTGPESFIEDFFMDGDYNGILMTGNVARIRHGRFQNGAKNAIRIRAEGGDNSQQIDDVLMGAQTPDIATAGIRVRNSHGLVISNTSVIQQGVGLLIDPYTATTGEATDAGGVSSLWAHHCFFDNNRINGIRICPNGTAPVVRLRFDNVWTSSSGEDGVLINRIGTGTINGIHFESLSSLLNTGSGIATGGAIGDISINGAEIAKNAFGIYQDAEINGFYVRGSVIGAGAGTSGNTNAAIVINSGSKGIIITDNDLRGNGSTISDNAKSVDNKVIRGNLGYNPIADTTIRVGTSPFTWTNATGETTVVFVNGGMVSNVSVNEKTVARATNSMILVPRGTSIVVTYSAEPAMAYKGM
jgi:hypothetical protein